MPASTSLRGRVPGQAVMGAVIEAQRGLPSRSSAARIFGRSPLTAATRVLYRAALGEAAVGESLDQLGPRWDILHVVPVIRAASSGEAAHHGQIDHLVIGPPGVFAIATENYPGQEVKITADSMMIGGRKVDDILDAHQLADAAARRLSAAAECTVAVQPVIVVIDSGRLVVRGQPSAVTIVGSKNLVRWLTTLDTVLDGPAVAEISNVADRHTTWASTPPPPEDALQLSADFAQLREQVRRATRSRVLWGVLGFVFVCVAAWVATVTVVEGMLGH